MRSWIFFVTAAFALNAPLSATLLDGRLGLSNESGTTGSIAVSQQLLRSAPWTVTVGPRLTLAPTLLHRLDYFADGNISLLFVSAGLRLHHGIHLNESLSLTHLVPYVRLDLPLFSLGALFFEVGWYFRSIALEKAAIIPYGRRDAAENDICTRFGFTTYIHDPWSLTLAAGTIDEVEIYNLNNPFIEIRVNDESADNQSVKPFFYTRYRMLLGFGRRDELLIGGGMRL